MRASAHTHTHTLSVLINLAHAGVRLVMSVMIFCCILLLLRMIYIVEYTHIDAPELTVVETTCLGLVGHRSNDPLGDLLLRQT